MPYISKGRRAMVKPSSSSDLAYLFAEAIDSYIAKVSLSFTSISAVLGAIESVRFEFLRRFAGPYEDEKIKENGEVFTTLKGYEDGANN